MCIRDSREHALAGERPGRRERARQQVEPVGERLDPQALFLCLLYTSDAADERSSVDLGGRRIIKKKKKRAYRRRRVCQYR